MSSLRCDFHSAGFSSQSGRHVLSPFPTASLQTIAMRWHVTAAVLASALCLLFLSVLQDQTTLDHRVPLLMTEYKWASLTDRQREIYVRGFLETVSFMLYSRSQKDNEEHAKTFSDWRFCAEKQPVSRWQTLDWTRRCTR